MSFCTSPMVAARRAVESPITATQSMAIGAWVNRMAERAVMYTPAVTMVAAWINAETGVGPAIASGSQTYRGICADFPAAPTSSSRQIAVAMPEYCRGCADAIAKTLL